MIDTNLLLLLIVGSLDRSKIGRKRLENYSKRDFQNLNTEIEKFSGHVSLPNILSETSNFLGSGKQQLVTGGILALKNYVDNLDEIYQPSSGVAKSDYYSKFGLTDAAIIMIAKSHNLHVITDDFPLYGYLSKLRVKATNLRHLSTPSDY
ncbi:MAG: hypothetical protein AAF429_06085 [Pseudomonadota bacterium]